MKDLDALDRRLADFVAAREWSQFHSAKNLAICLSVEASELLELFMWTREGEGPHPPGAGPPDPARVREEIGDVVLCLLNFARAAGVDPVEAAEEKLRALESKYPVELARGSAVKDPTRSAARDPE
jgi:NTP pyrophosphatase (non-canonical NTP hydrolase)